VKHEFVLPDPSLGQSDGVCAVISRC
jgi:hypothetical protein